LLHQKPAYMSSKTPHKRRLGYSNMKCIPFFLFLGGGAILACLVPDPDPKHCFSVFSASFCPFASPSSLLPPSPPHISVNPSFETYFRDVSIFVLGHVSKVWLDVVERADKFLR
jgi:hypothetical protein